MFIKIKLNDVSFCMTILKFRENFFRKYSGVVAQQFKGKKASIALLTQFCIKTKVLQISCSTLNFV